MERQLQRLSWLKVRELVPGSIQTIILPVGTVEAHGSSCLGADNYIPEAIAGAIAGRLNALVAPTLCYGITRSLYRYPGGIALNTETFERMVADILLSFADSGFKNVIVLNGHGGNNTALKSAAHRFHYETKSNIAVIHWFELCRDLTDEFFGHAGGHAGTDETAMVLAIDPSLVDQNSYDPNLAYQFRPGADVYPVPGSILLYKEGEGYPEFDVERSKQYFDKVVTAVGDFAEMVLARWRKFGL
ncbi:MAG: creatininase family protein [Candidatus Zixiibacteriota bacterium]